MRTRTQVAKALAPSIVYIDEIEKVLNTNKKLAKEWKK
jgi:SpoVK/Ycf46/Vps4 family AAA+-type ATPase